MKKVMYYYRSVYVESKYHAISATKQSGAELSVECLCHGICVYINARQTDVWMSVSVSLEDRFSQERQLDGERAKHKRQERAEKKRRTTAKCAVTGGQ